MIGRIRVKAATLNIIKPGFVEQFWVKETANNTNTRSRDFFLVHNPIMHI